MGQCGRDGGGLRRGVTSRLALRSVRSAHRAGLLLHSGNARRLQERAMTGSTGTLPAPVAPAASRPGHAGGIPMRDFGAVIVGAGPNWLWPPRCSRGPIGGCCCSRPGTRPGRAATEEVCFRGRVAQIESCGGEIRCGHRVSSMADVPSAGAVLLDLNSRQVLAMTGSPAGGATTPMRWAATSVAAPRTGGNRWHVRCPHAVPRRHRSRRCSCAPPRRYWGARDVRETCGARRAVTAS